ncbi:Pycsar system effector family protein [Pedobacter jamesrossensis]|uniref:Pycsar system effector family protein n=2 Tax=Pedobacter jamesrossensis TaxID=1908238 RepID=A0ABV8NMN1_9SPHI
MPRNVVYFVRNNQQSYTYYLPINKKARIRTRLKNLHKIQAQLKRFPKFGKKAKSGNQRTLSKIENSEIAEKGVETMFKITATNNQRLTSLADNKAHILITVNSIILSAIISILLRKLEDSSYLIYPTFILLSISLISMIFAILATRPNIPDGRFSHVRSKEQSDNLLFFGNFYRMSLQEYSQGMLKIMYDKKLIYQSLIKDIYGQGIVLGKKYLLLRIAYNVFMFGLIVSVLAFLVVFIWHQSTIPTDLHHQK